jgi:hypothetical protein
VGVGIDSAPASDDRDMYESDPQETVAALSCHGLDLHHLLVVVIKHISLNKFS